MKNRFSTVEKIMPPNTVVPTEWRLSRTGAAGEHQRQHAQNEGERGHQDGPQPDARRFDGGVVNREPLCAQLLGELHNQNAVLAMARPISITSPIWQ